MEILTIVALLAGCGILVYFVYRNNQTNKNAIHEGSARDRGTGFTRQKQIFELSDADFDRVSQSMQEAFEASDLPIRLDIYSNNQQIVFKSTHSYANNWSAELCREKSTSNRDCYGVSFCEWKDEDTTEMNQFLTTVEKTLLHLDSRTMVTIEPINTKSTTSFF